MHRHMTRRRPVDGADGVDERVKMLCGRWRDIRPVGNTTANVFDLLDINQDGTFRERLAKALGGGDRPYFYAFKRILVRGQL